VCKKHKATADNLAGQDVRPSAGALGAAFAKEAAKVRVKVWNLLVGATDELQVVDAGIGAEIKRLDALEQEIWMQVPVWGARDSYCLRFRT
jgi:hypothetical protein